MGAHSSPYKQGEQFIFPWRLSPPPVITTMHAAAPRMLRPAAVLVVRRMVTGRTATAMAPRQMTMMMGSAPAMGTASACAGRAFILFFCDSTTSALGGHV